MTFEARRRYRWRMSKIKTKADLLKAMRKYDACFDATKYVLAQPDTATAREIWLGCDRPDWLVWLGSHHRHAALRPFAYTCADRAVRVYAADALARSGLVAEAEKLRALAPIVDADTASAGGLAASEVVEEICAQPHTEDAYPDFVIRSTRAAANAAMSAFRGSFGFVSRHAHAAAAYVSEHCSTAEHTELHIQLTEIHALAGAVLIGA